MIQLTQEQKERIKLIVERAYQQYFAELQALSAEEASPTPVETKQPLQLEQPKTGPLAEQRKKNLAAIKTMMRTIKR